MNGDDLRDDIAQLEQRIEALRDRRERCRKIALAAKIAIVAGAVVGALTLLTVLRFYPSAFFGAVAAMIGGAVLLGSNKTTWEQTEEELSKAEALRDRFIGSIRMKVVGDEHPTVH
jgi:uncharacterized membrane protein YfcA